MLPRRHRLRHRRDFTATVRRGRRASAGRVVGSLSPGGADQPARVGLVVSRQIGNSVTRHRVARVLRHAAAGMVDRLPEGSTLVLRALPGAAQRDRFLAADVAAVVDRLTGSGP